MLVLLNSDSLLIVMNNNNAKNSHLTQNLKPRRIKGGIWLVEKVEVELVESKKKRILRGSGKSRVRGCSWVQGSSYRPFLPALFSVVVATT
jgi:hypothetical protein